MEVCSACGGGVLFLDSMNVLCYTVKTKQDF